jgi:hypothetical protein
MGSGQSQPAPPKECSCKQAADELGNEIKKAAGNLSGATLDAIMAGTGIDKTMNSMSRIVDRDTDQVDPSLLEKWQQIYYPDSREGLQNIENMENIDSIKFIRDAIQIRHDVFRRGENFQQDCTNNAFVSINEFLNQEKNDLNKLSNYYNTFLSDYESLYRYGANINNIIRSKYRELNNINSKINEYNNSLFVDNRKNNYQQKNFDFYKSIYFYILILYYSLFVLYLIFSNFFSEKQYTNKKLLFIIALYLILPIILKYLINYLVVGYIYLLEINNWKGPVLSYQDIIERKKE